MDIFKTSRGVLCCTGANGRYPGRVVLVLITHLRGGRSCAPAVARLHRSILGSLVQWPLHISSITIAGGGVLLVTLLGLRRWLHRGLRVPYFSGF